MLHLTDTHCHLDLNRFDSDRDELLERARQAGVRQCLIPAIDLDSIPGILALCDIHPDLYAAVGVHPNSAAGWSRKNLAALRDFARHPKVVAIGEIGLDYYWQDTPPATQQQALLDQLNLAAELNLPVIIHNREATSAVLAALLPWQKDLEQAGSPLANRPGVLHSYSDTLEPARQAISQHFYIGITGPVTFKNAQAFQAVVQQLPLDQLLIETDSPYLAPHPHRGQRNEPALVRLVAEKIAALQHLSLDQAASQTSENAAHLFGWGVSV